MKATKIPHSRGFTLVELITVMSIIAALSAISSIVIFRQLDKAKMVEAQVMARDIATISELWSEIEYTYPYTTSKGGGKGAPEVDQAYLTGDKDSSSKLISVLIGQNNAINKTEKNYLDGFPKGDNEGKGGLTRASLHGTQSSGGSNVPNEAIFDALTDPWGNPYIILFDHSGNGQVEADNSSFLGAYQNEVWSSANMVVISAGPDGEFNKINDVICIR